MLDRTAWLGTALIAAVLACPQPVPAAPQPEPVAPQSTLDEQHRYLVNGLITLYSNLNSRAPAAAPPVELRDYEQAIVARYGQPVDLGRLVQLMLFVDQVLLHHEGRRQIDGVLILRSATHRTFVPADALHRIAREIEKSEPLQTRQLAAMTQALYTNRAAGEFMRQVRAQGFDPEGTACVLLFVDQSDGMLDGRLLAPGRDDLVNIYRQHRWRPVVPFANKRGLRSWVTARQFIQREAVQPLLASHELTSGTSSERKLVRRLTRHLEKRLSAQPDEPRFEEGQQLGDLWSYPQETLERHGGDCEDLSFVVQSCFEALKIPSRLVFGRVWQPQQRTWEGHVWVEWNGKIIDLAYRTERRRVVSAKRRTSCPYWGFVWFDSRQVGLVEDWQEPPRPAPYSPLEAPLALVKPSRGDGFWNGAGQGLPWPPSSWARR